MKTQKNVNAAMLFSIAVPALFALVLLLPPSRELFLAATKSHPLIMGFVKFALLATVGEILAIRIATGQFGFAQGVIYKAAVWGIIGVAMALLLPVYSTGITAMPWVGTLEGGFGAFVQALATSISLNATFGLAMMASHRVTDTMIDMRVRREKVSLLGAIAAIDWTGFARVVALQNLPFFWVPAHTITFLLPGEYRVFVSAALSIVLGLLLASAKRKASNPRR